jgi:hypothetical protein
MKGIKCTSNEVNAILAGDKGQIRLVIKPQPCGTHAPSFQKYSDIFCFEDKFGGIRTIKPPHQIGDLIFAKEDFQSISEPNFNYAPHDWRREGRCIYEADSKRSIGMYGCVKWTSAHYMKQYQSRITLRIKDISVERLQEISEGGVRDEGFDILKIHPLESCFTPFKEHWNATHKKPEEKWEANCWVWKIEIEVVK